MGWFANAFHPLRKPALAAFSGQPRGQRLHAAIRWALAPFAEVVEALPEHGLCVDMGCGAGLFAQAAVAAHPELQVLGVDIDQRRIRVANAAAHDNPRLRFLCQDWMKLSIDHADAFVFIDVLHHVAEAEQRKLLAYCASLLSPGGSILIKEVGLRPRWKYACNYLFDLSTALLRVTLGAARCYHDASWWMQAGGPLGLTGVRIPLRHRDYAPHYLVKLTYGQANES